MLWMAEGLIQQPEGDKKMEDLGAYYFRELFLRSFFLPSNHTESRFVMHDLINDLAQFVAGELYFSLDDKMGNDKQQIASQRFRYLSFIRRTHDVFKKFDVFNEMEQLRTFVALPIHAPHVAMCSLTAKVFDDLLPKMRHLRVLSLSGYEINELPNSVGDLKYLRYLNLSCTSLEQLPETMGSLYNLQALILQSCQYLTKLPVGIQNLINLRHLDITNTRELEEMPPRIGNLINLQTLSKFIVDRGNGLRIKELKNLSNLQGKLCILGLHEVVDIRDAMDAKLNGKCHIEELVMEWSSDFDGPRNEMNEMRVLELLQPHQNLRKLTIASYGGRLFPNWFGEPSFSTMVCLILKTCKRCTSLPSLGQLSSLKDLHIEGIWEVQTIGVEFYGETVKPFPLLESLKFIDMPEWRDWVFPNFFEEREGLFPSLRELTIMQCLKLTRLPSHLPSLVKLNVDECPVLTVSLGRLPSLLDINLRECNEMVLKTEVDVTSLTTLNIGRISRLTCLQEGFTALEVLVVNYCDELTFLCENGFGLQNLDHLRRLEVNGCPGLVSLGEQGLPLNLQYLQIYGCVNLEKLPNALAGLISLTELILNRCPKLESFPRSALPCFLRRLEVVNCRSLKSLPGGMMLSENCKSCALEYLEIRKCPSLICFPRGKLPMTLKQLRIEDCEKLQSLPEGIMHHSSTRNSNACSLEFLKITGCSSLTSFPSGKLPSTLKQLVVRDCEQLKSISGEMLQLIEVAEISNCPNLDSFPAERGLSTPIPNVREFSISHWNNLKFLPHCMQDLTSLEIENCENLKFLPDHLQNLPSLHYLYISNCPGLMSFPEAFLTPNLKSLKIEDCENLKTPLSEWGLHRLTSLKDLCINGGFSDVVSFSNDEQPLCLPISLTYLCLASFQNLKSIASLRVQSLISLQISNCPKLQSFVPIGGLPATLGKLEISDCPILKPRCLKEKGKDWPKIAHIPCLRIY